MTKQTDELAALKARVEELERAAKPEPQPKPFVSEPYQRYDPTAGMSMPPSALLEMARAVPDHVMKNIALRDARAPTGRPSAIPVSQQPASTSARNVAGSGTGWAHAMPLSADDRDRMSLAERCAPYGKDDVK